MINVLTWLSGYPPMPSPCHSCCCPYIPIHGCLSAAAVVATMCPFSSAVSAAATIARILFLTCCPDVFLLLVDSYALLSPLLLLRNDPSWCFWQQFGCCHRPWSSSERPCRLPGGIIVASLYKLTNRDHLFHLAVLCGSLRCAAHYGTFCYGIS